MYRKSKMKIVKSILMVLLMLFAIPAFAFSANTTSENTTTDVIAVTTTVDNTTTVEEENETAENDAEDVESEKEDETESKIEIQVEIKDTMTEIQVEINGQKTDYVLETTNEAEIIADISTKFGLTEEEILSAWEFNSNMEDEMDQINDDLEESEKQFREQRREFNKEEIKERDAHITKTPLGAKVRVLQLQKRIELQANSAEIVIAYLANKNVSTTDLELTSAEFEGLLIELDSIDLENKTADELAEEFVAIKDAATELTKKFKTTAGPLLTQEDKDALKVKLEVKKKEHEEKEHKNLDKYMNEYNLEKAKEIMNRMGLDPIKLAEQYKNGEITLEELKTQIMSSYGQLGEGKKDEAVAKLREEKQRTSIDAKEREQQIRAEADKRVDQLHKQLKEQEGELQKLRAKLRESENGDRYELREKLEKSGEFKYEARERFEANEMPEMEKIRERMESEDFKYEMKDGEIRIESDGQKLRIREGSPEMEKLKERLEEENKLAELRDNDDEKSEDDDNEGDDDK